MFKCLGTTRYQLLDSTNALTTVDAAMEILTGDNPSMSDEFDMLYNRMVGRVVASIFHKQMPGRLKELEYVVVIAKLKTGKLLYVNVGLVKDDNRLKVIHGILAI